MKNETSNKKIVIIRKLQIINQPLSDQNQFLRQLLQQLAKRVDCALEKSKTGKTTKYPASFEDTTH